MSPVSWWRGVPTCPSTPMRSVSAARSRSTALSRSMSGASTRTRGGGELFSISPLRRHVSRRPRPGAHRQRDHAGARPSAHPPPRLPARPGQVRRHRGIRPPDHAVVLRKPVDVRSRRGRSAGRSSPTVGATCSRGSASAAAPACSTRVTRNSSRHCLRSSPTGRCTRGSGRTAASTSARTTPGPCRAEVPRHVRSPEARAAAGARRSSRCPGGSRARGATSRPPTSARGIPSGAVVPAERSPRFRSFRLQPAGGAGMSAQSRPRVHQVLATLGTATPSATRCSASRRVLRGGRYRIGDLRRDRIRGSKTSPIDYREWSIGRT